MDDIIEVENAVPWSEPVLIPEVVVDGMVLVKSDTGGLRLVGTANIIGADGGVTERRVVLRCAVPANTVAAIGAKLLELFGGDLVGRVLFDPTRSLRHH